MRNRLFALVLVLVVLVAAIPAQAQDYARRRESNQNRQYQSLSGGSLSPYGSPLDQVMRSNQLMVHRMTRGLLTNRRSYDYGYQDYGYSHRGYRRHQNGSTIGVLNLAVTGILGAVVIHKQNETNRRLQKIERRQQEIAAQLTPTIFVTNRNPFKLSVNSKILVTGEGTWVRRGTEISIGYPSNINCTLDQTVPAQEYYDLVLDCQEKS